MEEEKADLSKRALMQVGTAFLKTVLGLPETAEIIDIRKPACSDTCVMLILSPDFPSAKAGYDLPEAWPVFHTDKHGATKLEDWGFPKSEEEDD